MLGGNSVTYLQITLSAGIPSLLYVMNNNSWSEMSFKDRFDEVMSRYLESKGMNESKFLTAERSTLLDGFLRTVVDGGKSGVFFESFSTPVGPQQMRFPIPYIPIILQYMGENDGVGLFDSLKVSAETVESGRAWELVVMFSLYIRSLSAKYCEPTEKWRGPFNIATDRVNDVKVLTIPSKVQTIQSAVNHIQDLTNDNEIIYIFQLAYSKFPDFDGFLSYRSPTGRLTIHGIQCKLTRGYPRHISEAEIIPHKWFLRGGMTVETPDRHGWNFPTKEGLEANLLGFGLSVLHPMAWGDVPDKDEFD
jgi:hypothetical protein